MVGALTQHAKHAKSQSAATFFKGAMPGFCQHYTIIDLVSSSAGSLLLNDMSCFFFKSF